MPRWLVLSVSLVAVLTTVGFSAPPNPPAPVIKRDFPDPDVLRVGDTFFAYATNSHGINVQAAKSPSLRGPWQKLPEAMPTKLLPEWVGKDGNGMHNIWAPEVVQRADGRFILYYAAFHKRFRHHCLGVAISDTARGPFRAADQKPLVCGENYDEIIDPNHFIDTDGQRYLLYKRIVTPLSEGGTSTIRIQGMSKDGLRLVGPSMDLLKADRPGEADVIEAPTLVHRPEGYVLFYSANVFNSGHYFTNYATAPHLFGPYTKAPGTFLSRRTLNGAVLDPGGQDINPAADRIIYHGDLRRPGGPRGMFVSGLQWRGLHPQLRA